MGAKCFKANGFYLAAEEGHLEGHTEKSKKTDFHIEEHDGGKKVSLKTHTGHYVAMNANHEIYMAHSHASDEAKFFLEQHDNDRVALRSQHGGYLGVDASGRTGVSRSLGTSELFEEVKA